MHGAGVSHRDRFLNLSYHQDPGEHLFHLLPADGLDGIPDRAVGGYHRLRSQVERVIPAFHALRAVQGKAETARLAGNTREAPPCLPGPLRTRSTDGS